jgi:hypothetical protein
MSESDPDQLQAKTLEEERMEDVLLMLQHLTRNEEVTIKIIIDCLYDVGSVNLINQKVPYFPFNGILKQIAKLSKPAFRIVAFYWFKKNCPPLITKWLRSKVSFKKPVAREMAKTAHQVQETLEGEPALNQTTVEGKPAFEGKPTLETKPSFETKPTFEGTDIELYSQSKIDLLTGEVQRLRSQVRLISGISIGAIAALGGVILWMNYGRINTPAQQPAGQFQMTTVEQD